MKRVIVMTMVASLVGWGCGSGGSTSGTDYGPFPMEDGKGEGVEVPERQELPPVVIPEYPDLADAGREEVAEPAEAGEVEADVPGNCPGGSGCPCLTNDECDSGLCIETMAGWVCMTPCLSEESCPKGWTCQAVAGTGSDLIYGCVDRTLNLCRPCRYDADCVNNLWGGTNRCLSYGPEGSFCGVQCQGAGDCPAGYECVEGSEGGRTPLKQCRRPEGDPCPCLEKYEDKGYLTECYIENEHGKCTDLRTCAEPCEAKTPSEEVCDGKDNDCDGDTDEGVQGQPCPLTNAWGTCFGKVLCNGGNLFCEGEYPSAEQCDGKDSDCDGQTDEGFLDTDGDGIADCVDDDMDGDGVLNGSDNCPWDKNPGQENCDDDAYGDACDGDDDDDGVPNGWDNCRCLANALQQDLDKDGKGDACDCDVDGDGVFNANPGCPTPVPVDNCVFLVNPSQSNLDGDEIGDACDCDLDGDGVGNDNPGCPTPAPRDNCPTVYNPDQGDENGNGLGDACDDDADLDGVKDGVDNCVVVWNPDQADQDGDQVGDACDCDLDGDDAPNAGKDVDGGNCPPCEPCDNCPGVANPGQEDLDGDGEGDACDVDRDGDGDPNFLDCAPDDPTLFHGAPEHCNLVDDDCDGVVDEDNAAGCATYYYDLDRDGYGVTENGRCLCGPVGYYTAERFGDCDDNNQAANPEAAEVCKNAKDDNCNGFTDEEGADGCSWFYRDLDGDAYGVEGEKKCLCKMEVPYTSLLTGDCNDYDNTVKPGATEACNGRDDDCDGKVDEENAQGCTTYYLDADQDGWGVPGQSKCLCQREAPYTAKTASPEDCDDQDAGVKPNAVERCNGKDDDCDGFTDEDDAVGCTLFFLDQDRDGWGVATQYVCLCAPKPPYDAVKAGDCDDFYAVMNPQAPESCDGKDNNCDGRVDEEGALGCYEYHRDGDGDGWGTDLVKCLCDASGKYTADVGGDCNDVDKNVYPGAMEACNGRDDDCDTMVDEEDALGCVSKFYDGDQDGYGVASDARCLCKSAGLYTASVTGDCDDGDAKRNPGAQEKCNGMDDNCNNLTDEEGAADCTIYFYDYDWDTYGGNDYKCLCAPYQLYRAVVGGDCNDSSSVIRPGATEKCNGADDDCDGIVDPENAQLCGAFYKDADGDQYGNPADSKCLCAAVGMYRTTVGTDCDDQDVTVNPGAQELCANGKDDNCNGQTDDDEIGGCQGCINYFEDVDGDTYGKTQVFECLAGPSGNLRATRGGDCNDDAASVNPGAPEHCNAVDDDCDALTDEEGAADCVPYFYDDDADGYGVSNYECRCAPSGKFRAPSSGDCNDTAKFVNPGATEACNGADDNCNGQTDEAGATGCQAYYQDNDQDGWGQDVSKCLCAPVSPYTANRAADCDDYRASVNPNGVEECNGRDDDCDGLTDEENSVACVTHYRDNDADTYGVVNDFKCLCYGAGAYTAIEAGDCDDAKNNVFPGATETCNGRDDNCNALTDEPGALDCTFYYFDGDNDGFGTATVQAKCLCAPQSPFTAFAPGDCLDSSAAVKPGATETCNWLDDDCDGQTDEEGATGCQAYYYDNDGDGIGVASNSKCLCQPSGKYTASTAGDCNDNDAAVKPGGAEVCNGSDDDCDGAIDEEGAIQCKPFYKDNDLDGWGTQESKCLCLGAAPYTAAYAGDCDDTQAAVGPGSPEACNGRDDDCDGLTDEENAANCTNYYRDLDQDGYGTSQFRCLCAPSAPWSAVQPGDCNDSMASIKPGAADVCNGIDDNCDGQTDPEGAAGCQTWYLDNDGDGYGQPGNSKCLCQVSGKYTASGAGDCNDSDALVRPGATEVCNGRDDDCDGQTDEEGAASCLWYMKDADGDGYGVASDKKCLCAPSGQFSATQGGDCDDAAGLIHPGGSERCNAKDDDCDGVTDPADSQGCTTFYRDSDGDTVGVLGDYRCLCAAAAPYSAVQAGDCNDSNAQVKPGAVEKCNVLDDDCDGVTDGEGVSGCETYYFDNDGDGVGVASNSKCLCAPSGKYATKSSGDCNDSNFSIYPGQTEVCNGKDDNCDGATDDEGVSGCTWYMKDADGDGFGVSTDKKCLCMPSGSYTATTGGDCDDAKASTYPGATEVCANGKDDDCDGATDEAGCQGCTTYFKDEDGDTYGVSGDTQCLSAPSGTYRATRGADCNDSDAAVNPGAAEACNGKDDNCDGQKDGEGSSGCTTYHWDQDADTYGLTSNTKCLCAASAPYTATRGGDCNDVDSSVHPGGVESCNGKDDDCDGQTDEEGAYNCATKYLDNDQDGYGTAAQSKCLCGPSGRYTADITGDCDDNDPNAKPGGNEVCGNNKDDDCDGQTDEAGCGGCTTYYLDEDGDTYGQNAMTQCLSSPSGNYRATRGGDCKDNDAAINPGATESCNGKDDDCDAATDEEGSQGCSTFYMDQDGDTYGKNGDTRCLCSGLSPYIATRGGDCDDTSASVKPGAAERCNLVDDDCDGTTDNEGAQGCATWYYDSDGDGYGVNGNSKCLCSGSGMYRAQMAGDCDDADPQIKPGATEVCNGKDDNCDGQGDPEGAPGCQSWYYDFDGDGFGTSLAKCLCGSSGLYRTQVPGDCNDSSNLVYPGANERCNGSDDDCDGQVDEEGAANCSTYYYDGDNDGYGSSSNFKCLCGPWGLYIRTLGGDCDDSSQAINPSASERCNGLDDNCTGQTDEGDASLMCGAVQNGSPVCTGGQCGALCDSGYFDVNRSLMDGCECQWDQYDSSGNACAQAVNLGALSDAGSGSTYTLTGRIVPDSDVDWYKVTASDSTDTGTFSGPGHDRFHVRVRLTSPTDGTLKVNVYRGTCSTQTQCVSGTFNATDVQWYANFSNPTSRIGEDPCVTPPGPRLWNCCKPGEDNCNAANQDACCGGKNNDNTTQCDDETKNKRHCMDDGTTFYVKVYRASGSAPNCGQTEYTLVITNGVQ